MIFFLKSEAVSTFTFPKTTVFSFCATCALFDAFFVQPTKQIGRTIKNSKNACLKLVWIFIISNLLFKSIILYLFFLCKDNANERNENLFSNCRVQLILCKDKQKMKDFSLFNHFYILILNRQERYVKSSLQIIQPIVFFRIFRPLK